MIQDLNDNFWIGTTSGLSFYDNKNQVIKPVNYDDNTAIDNWIRTLYCDRSGKIWIGTDNGGLNVLDPVSGQFRNFSNQANVGNTLSNDKVYSIMEDVQGNMWIGTFRGVNILQKYASNFTHIYKSAADQFNLNSNIVWSFEEDNEGRFWIGTSGGVNIYDPTNGKYVYLEHDPLNPKSLSDNDVRVVHFTPEHNCFWFGTYGSGLNKFDILTRQFTYFRSNPNKNSIGSNYINDILTDSKGDMWFATGNGLCKLNKESTIFEHYTNDPNDSCTISNNIVICLYEDNDGYLWIGTDKGLNRMNPATQKFSRYYHDPFNRRSLGHNTVFALHMDFSGNMWIGTSGGGLAKFDPVNNEFTNYTTHDGLPNNVIYGILQDHNNNLWISTNQGLSRMSLEDETFVNYDAKDGIQSNEFNLGARYIAKDGRMYFGGMNGYNVFYPEQIKSNPNKPVIAITAFRKFNELQPGEFYNGDTITLAWDDNFFSFEFSALDYTNPAKNRYRYKLENFDKDWIITTAANRLAEYKKVEPGLYIFKVNGTNNDGVWNDTGVTLNIYIKPAWFQTWLFRIFLALVLIGLIWYLVFSRVRKIKLKNKVERKVLEIEKQKFDLEQKALRLQMNPHFIFNSLNSIQSYILSHDTKTAITYLGKFSRLMRLILSHSANKFITLKEELDAVKHYLDLEKLRFEDKFEYNLTIDPGTDEDFIEIPPMILQPYVENAVIHGLLHKKEKGYIKIDIKSNEENIHCIVEDDGIGRLEAERLVKEKGMKKKSRGMLITKARLEILNRQSSLDFTVNVVDLKDNNGNPAGTRVELTLPAREV